MATPKLTSTERAYLAGIIDGEGCIGIGVRKRHNRKYIVVTLQITNTSRDLIEWITERFGGGIYPHDAKVSASRGRKHAFLWSVAAKRATDIIRLAFPYLLVKRQQAELVLSIPRRQTYRDTVNGRIRVQMTAADFAENERLIGVMRALNQRGIGHATQKRHKPGNGIEQHL